MNSSGTNLCVSSVDLVQKENPGVHVAWFHNTVFIQIVLGKLYESVTFCEDRIVLVLTTACSWMLLMMSMSPACRVFHTLMLLLFSKFIFSRAEKTQLSTLKLSSFSSCNRIFMSPHLFRIMYRESYPPRGKLVRRELSIMSFGGHFPYFSHRYLGPSTRPLRLLAGHEEEFSFTVRLDFLRKVCWVCFPCRFPM